MYTYVTFEDFEVVWPRRRLLISFWAVLGVTPVVAMMVGIGLYFWYDYQMVASAFPWLASGSITIMFICAYLQGVLCQYVVLCRTCHKPAIVRQPSLFGKQYVCPHCELRT